MEKIPFHESIGDEDSESTFELLQERFTETYEDYKKKRSQLHSVESDKDKQESPTTAFEELDHVREHLSDIVIQIYQQSHSLEEFEGMMHTVLTRAGNVPPGRLSEYILGARLYPPSLREKKLSPVESIWTTIENMKIINEFRDIGEKSVDGILLSGAHAWGPFFAVRGKAPQELLNSGLEKSEYGNFSDIDLMINTENVDGLNGTVNNFIAAGLVDESEKKRLEAFEDLWERGAADIFSIRAHYRGVEESIHFLLNKTVESISHLSETGQVDGIGYVNDFRPSIPQNILQHGSYPLFDLRDGKRMNFSVHLKPVPSLVGRDPKNLGYISQTPTGGRGPQSEKQRYYLGLLAFYLLIAPSILYDRDGFLKQQTQEIKSRVREILGGSLPSYIIRQERMTTGTLSKIRASLT